MTTLLAARSQIVINSAAPTEVEIPLAAVDLSSRKIPLIHQVEFQGELSSLDGGINKFTACLASSDSIDSTYIDDDEVIDSVSLSGLTIAGDPETGSFLAMLNHSRLFKSPIAIAKSSLWLHGTGDANAELTVHVRVWFQVKTVTSNVLVALLA